MKALTLKHRIDTRYVICIVILAALIIMSAFCFRNSFWRFIESCRDFGLSIAYYFCELFGIDHNINVTVTTLPTLPSTEPVTVPTPDVNTGVIPFDSELFYLKMKIWGQTLINGETYGRFFGIIANGIFAFVRIIMLFLPFFAVFIGLMAYLRKKTLSASNNNYGGETPGLIFFKKISSLLYQPLKSVVRDVYHCLRDVKAFHIIFLMIWLFDFNILTIGIEALAYAFYFVSCFDFVHLYIQLYKLFIDLSFFLVLTPLWLILLLPLIAGRRKRIGERVLLHNEMKNRGFINARGIVVMLCGSMGVGKTALATDMALSQSAIFRNKCLDTLIKLDSSFPYFKWINLERDIRRAMVEHEIFNLPTCRKYIHTKRDNYISDPAASDFYGYEECRYGRVKDNGLKELDIWEVIEVYAQIYFTYVTDTSYIISNYAIRDDCVMKDKGNLPIWDIDFFRDASSRLTASKYSHILDFDALRFGKKMIKNNKYSDTFAFCAVWVISEGGKERGNQYDIKGLDKKSEEANRVNDLFNVALKLIRHPSTIDNIPFARVIMDEQRPESWGADGRELADLVYIREKDDTKLAMPFFWIEELIYMILAPKYNRKYTDFRYRRGDMSLPMYIYKSLCTKFLNYYVKIYNCYGYNVMHLDIEQGMREGEFTDHEYYLSAKKTFANRYSTDVYRDYFDKRAEKVECGLTDYPEYKEVRVTDEEFDAQHSYFYSDLKSLNSVAPAKEKTESGEPKRKEPGN